MNADKLVKLVNKTADKFNSQPVKKRISFISPKKVVIILPEYIGDILLLTPAIRNLSKSFGNSVKIDLVGNKNAKNLLETLPYFDNFYLEGEETGRKVSFLKKQNYDTIFLFNIRFFWALAGYQAKVQQRVGFNLEKLGLENIFLWRKLMTHLIKSATVYDKRHQINIYMDMLKTLQLEVDSDFPEVLLSDNDIKKANTLIKDISGGRVLIHATAGSPGKQWNFNNWAVIIKYLKEKYNFSIIATGCSAEKSIYDYISRKSGVEIHNLCGKTTIRETIALYKHIDLAITLDTASAHFAAAANTKNIIVIYGPTNETQWKPYTPYSFIQQICLDLDCRPCLTRLCRHRKCLSGITPDMVIDAIENAVI
ncbi:MAG: glycosyltransferase family 9 protein [Candidatus Gastranaerophilales bacterium]|nr:glycosyltransferase family 9 protein [Candidatus Gastranaerophilales bacterium]